MEHLHGLPRRFRYYPKEQVHQGHLVLAHDTEAVEPDPRSGGLDALRDVVQGLREVSEVLLVQRRDEGRADLVGQLVRQNVGLALDLGDAVCERINLGEGADEVPERPRRLARLPRLTLPEPKQAPSRLLERAAAFAVPADISVEAT